MPRLPGCYFQPQPRGGTMKMGLLGQEWVFKCQHGLAWACVGFRASLLVELCLSIYR